MTKDELDQINVEKGEKASVTISGEVPFSYLEKHKDAALEKLGENVEIPGFRKGHVPEKQLIEHVGETALLKEMAERALSEVYPEVVKEHELDVIGYPQIGITKLAMDNPLGFSATVAVMPEITLPDYKAIASETNKEKASSEVTDEDVDAQIKDILRQKVAYERLQEKAAKKAAAENQEQKDDLGNATELPTPETMQQKDEGADTAEEDDVDPENLPLPELTDEYVKTLGQPGQFESVDDFKQKVREHLETEKQREAASAHRAKITDAIIEKTEMEVPQVMIDAEMNQMFAQMEEDLQRAGLTMDSYLEHVKKTKEELQREWAPAAEKRAKLQLILNEIAKEETVSPDPSVVDQEVSKLLEQHKDADESRVRTYVESVLTNEEVMKLLEQS